jgi:hypothetical protein
MSINNPGLQTQDSWERMQTMLCGESLAGDPPEKKNIFPVFYSIEVARM